LHLPQLQTKKRTLFSHNRASGPVRRVKYPQADLRIRFSTAHQVRLVWYTKARLPSTRVSSNNDPPSWPDRAPAQFFNSIFKKKKFTLCTFHKFFLFFFPLPGCENSKYIFFWDSQPFYLFI
jgi:hypothetical protein